MNPNQFKVNLTPNQVLCCGCFEVISKAFAHTGKINKGVSFIERTSTELVFDPSTGKVSVEEVEKKVPIGKWIRGFICSKCASDYRTVERKIKHTGVKDGKDIIWYEVSHEPRVKLDPSATLHQTLNTGGDSYNIPMSSPPPDDGFGFTQLEASEELHIGCYNKFARGVRS